VLDQYTYYFIKIRCIYKLINKQIKFHAHGSHNRLYLGGLDPKNRLGDAGDRTYLRSWFQMIRACSVSPADCVTTTSKDVFFGDFSFLILQVDIYCWVKMGDMMYNWVRTQ
jgi:hypothetical protein